MKRKGSKSCSNRLEAKLQSKSSKNASISVVFSATPYYGEEVAVVEVRLGESVRTRAVLGMFNGENEGLVLPLSTREDDGDDEGQNEGLVESGGGN
jgi:hypothetical protein